MSTKRGTALIALVLSGFMSGCSGSEGDAAPAAVEVKTAPRTVQLYFEGPDALLGAEPRTLQLAESDEAAIAPVLNELIKGPKTPMKGRGFPADAVLRGAYLLPEGTAIVDVGGATLAAGWNTGSHAEMMALHAVAHTVAANFRSARRVRLLVNGQPAETLGGHIRIDHPFVPDSSLLRR